MAIDDSDDDPFFSDNPVYPGEHVNAWELDEQSDWLRDHGYEPGDSITVTWEGNDGDVHQTEIPLPADDWDDPESWHDFYEDMREFYEDVWGEDSYQGEATAG